MGSSVEKDEIKATSIIANIMMTPRELRRRRSNRNLRRSSLFTLYAKIFRLLLSKWESGVVQEDTDSVDEYNKELEDLVLPSNEEWRLRVYYSLVQLQRENDHAIAVAALQDNIP